MNERVQFQGMWWLPDDPDIQVPGTLTFDPDQGATLELLGSFKKNLKELGTYPRPKQMLGSTSDGKFITLQDCFETRTRMAMPGMTTANFHADMVLVGAHFEEESEVAFKKLSVEYLHLDEWA